MDDAIEGGASAPRLTQGLAVLNQVHQTKPPVTLHVVGEGDARNLAFISDGSIHLICTSPPYASLVAYPDRDGQLGNLASHDSFLEELDKAWAECLRVLVPGGRVACVVGDVCISHREGGRHHVLPLTGDIRSRARRLGFDNLTPIRWEKVTNARLEASRSTRYLGKPNQPNGIIKNDIETVVLLRKPGGYRKPTLSQEADSFIPLDEYARLFVPVWRDIPGQVRARHPSPYPIEIPRRLIRMFSYAGDVVLDPFAGTGTTGIAASQMGRHSVSVDIEPDYINLIADRFRREGGRFADLRVYRGTGCGAENRPSSLAAMPESYRAA